MTSESGEDYDISSPVEESTNVNIKENWFELIGNDLKGRVPVYGSDWTVENGEQLKKIAAATLFAYFTSVLPG